MSFIFHRERKQVVKYAGDDNGSVDRRTNPPPEAERIMKNTHEGPFFPNLQLMFKNKQQDPSNTLSEEKIDSKTNNKTVAGNEEDINMEANEFIKRRHHDLYLQKLMSMNAASQPS